ncbi:MAG: response regulator [Candidatus Kerfeldbacteria bacterium]|nr:response regulator [Candidatus Kerfeldbacteria bacterium]
MARLVIIEDEPGVLLSLKTALTSAGHAITTATDGVAGLAAIRDRHPDLVILDIVLPRMNGLDVLSTVKRDATLSDIPVIVLTNIDREEDIERARSLGAVDYCVKSNVSIDEVTKKVETHLGRASTKRS